MSNAVFPSLPGLMWDVEKTPVFNTIIQTPYALKNEVRISLMPQPQYTFKLAYEVLRQRAGKTELDTLEGFFLSRQGAYDSFLLNLAAITQDPADGSVTAMNFGTGDGSTRAFQLGRTRGGFFEQLFDLNGAAQIFVNGTLKTITTDYTLSSTGLVTFVSAPAAAAPITWTGAFYYRVRFKDDLAAFNNFAFKLWELKQIDLVGVST